MLFTGHSDPWPGLRESVRVAPTAHKQDRNRNSCKNQLYQRDDRAEGLRAVRTPPSLSKQSFFYQTTDGIQPIRINLKSSSIQLSIRHRKRLWKEYYRSDATHSLVSIRYLPLWSSISPHGHWATRKEPLIQN